MMQLTNSFRLLLLTSLALIAQSQVIPSGYAPLKATCPSSPLVRAASGLSSSESAYVAARKTQASTALASWLKKTNSNLPTSNLPTIVLTTSGGGLRSLLTGAGVIQGFDSRDSTVGTSGVFQGLTYQSGLSGGAWLLSSFAGNNYPTISSLKTGLWEQAFQDSLLDPSNLLVAAAYVAITNDIKAKNAAGFPPTLVDPYGRLLSYQLLLGADGGVTDRLSGISSLSNFTAHNVPYPIITSLGVEVTEGQCIPPANGTQYELHPYEFGSWDAGVSAFTQTAYLGTNLTNGAPITTGSCIMNYDNLGYVLGTSSDLFDEACVPVPATNDTSNIADVLALAVANIHTLSVRDEYAVYPNPFYQRPASSLVASQPLLYLVDGGETNQNDPIWPFIQPSRPTDVLIVNDNSADTPTNFPNGTELYDTYQRAQAVGLTRMPVIPPVATFISEGLSTRPTFFGCGNNNTLTIVYLPNINYTFPSGESTFKLQYTKAETDGMIANGVQVASKNGDPGWPTCLGCAFVMKTGGTLPAVCTTCFNTYCFKQ